MIILRKQNFLPVCIQARRMMVAGKLVSQNARPRHASARPSISATDESSALSPKLLELQLFQLLVGVIHSKAEHGLIICLSSFWSFSFFYCLQFWKICPAIIKHPTDNPKTSSCPWQRLEERRNCCEPFATRCLYLAKDGLQKNQFKPQTGIWTCYLFLQLVM